ncbi:MAG TPA: phage integrase family protein [Burkholderiaceae bacterium]|nr:phage integrase family protein [Burkholderiaceae bacterium]
MNNKPPPLAVHPVGRPIGRHQLVFLREIIEGTPLKRAGRHLCTADDLGPANLRAELELLGRALRRASTLLGREDLFDAVRRRLRSALAAADRHALNESRIEARLQQLRDSPGAWAFDDDELLAQAAADIEFRGGKPPTEREVLHARKALDELALHVATPPKPEHPVALWFGPRLARRLVDAGLNSLVDLAGVIDAYGHRWYARVRGIGAKRAAAIVRWLRAECTSGPEVVGSAALLPESKLTREHLIEAIRRGRAMPTLDALTVPAECDGSQGTNRAPRALNITGADNDHEALQRWLLASTVNEGTRREYRREVERLLLWCVYEKGKALSSLAVDDCIEYREFLVALSDPQAPWPWRLPRERWIAPRRVHRRSPVWRPFSGRLSRDGIERALLIVRACGDWLAKTGYLVANPWRAVAINLQAHRAFRSAADSRLQRQQRSLGESERRFLEQAIDNLGGDERAVRARFLVAFAVYAGLRRDEFARARCADIRPVDVQGRRRYELVVVGKGGRERAVPLPRPAIDVLAAYLQLRGLRLDALDRAGDEPLIASLPPSRQALTAQRLYAIFKWLCARAADLAEQAGEAETAAKLRQASTHWLRHTFGTRGAAAMPATTLMELMGHADIRTTLRYVSPDRTERFRQVDAAFADATR